MWPRQRGLGIVLGSRGHRHGERFSFRLIGDYGVISRAARIYGVWVSVCGLFAPGPDRAFLCLFLPGPLCSQLLEGCFLLVGRIVADGAEQVDGLFTDASLQFGYQIEQGQAL